MRATRWELPSPASIDNRAVNVGTGKEVSVNELAHTLIAAAGASVSVEHADARPGELARSSVGITKAADVWGWQPKVTLSEGLQRTYRWIVEEAR